MKVMSVVTVLSFLMMLGVVNNVVAAPEPGGDAGDTCATATQVLTADVFSCSVSDDDSYDYYYFTVTGTSGTCKVYFAASAGKLNLGLKTVCEEFEWIDCFDNLLVWDASPGASTYFGVRAGSCGDSGVVEYTLTTNCSGDASLPVTLSLFRALKSSRDGKVTLHWRTETEVNNVGWRIMRSETKDGKFVRIGFVEGAGSTGMPTDYEFVDKTAKPLKVYYYYIEDVDVEGIKTKSKVIMSRKIKNAATVWGKIKKIR